MNGKLIASFALAASASFASLIAVDDAEYQALNEKVIALEQRQKKKRGEITPVANPLQMGVNVFITADLLYWFPRETGLSYVTEGFISPQNSLVLVPSSVEHLNWEWDFGAKVGLGINLNIDGWDLYTQWTYFQSSARSSRRIAPLSAVFAPGSPILLAEWSLPFDSTQVSLVNVSVANWSLNFDTLDLELGRSFWLSEYLAIRPHFGKRAAYTYTQFKIDNNESTDTGGPLVEERIRFVQKYWGVGLRAGLDTDWHFSKNWSLYANFAMSLLWGMFDIEKKDTVRTSNAPSGLYKMRFNDQFHTLEPVIDYALGIKTAVWFFDNTAYFALSAGWEQHYWFNQNQLDKFTDASFKGTFVNGPGNLTLSGAVVRARLDF